MVSHALTEDEIRKQLDTCLDVEFTFYNNEKPARIIAQQPAEQRDYVLSWVNRVASTNHQLAWQFMNRLLELFNQLDQDTIESWALQAMDAYDANGLYPALEIIQNIDDFLQRSHDAQLAASLEANVNILSHFAHGLSGRKLKLETAEQAFTDTETLYLPPLLAQLDSSQDNFDLYKSMVAMLWAQTRFGTFRENLYEIAGQQDNPEHFLKLFHCIETLRLERCIANELPGLHRRMQSMKQTLQQDRLDDDWQTVYENIRNNELSADDSIKLATEYADKLKPFDTLCYQGILDLEKIEAVKNARIEREKNEFSQMLRKILDELKQNETKKDDSEAKFGINKIPDANNPDGFQFNLTLNEQPITPPDEVQNKMNSIIQDLGDIPPQYMVPAGDGEYDPKLGEQQEKQDPASLWHDNAQQEGVFMYNEWDFRRQHYRKNWCAVREQLVKPKRDEFIGKTLKKYSPISPGTE